MAKSFYFSFALCFPVIVSDIRSETWAVIKPRLRVCQFEAAKTRQPVCVHDSIVLHDQKP